MRLVVIAFLVIAFFGFQFGCKPVSPEASNVKTSSSSDTSQVQEKSGREFQKILAKASGMLPQKEAAFIESQFERISQMAVTEASNRIDGMKRAAKQGKMFCVDKIVELFVALNDSATQFAPVMLKLHGKPSDPASVAKLVQRQREFGRTKVAPFVRQKLGAENGKVQLSSLYTLQDLSGTLADAGVGQEDIDVIASNMSSDGTDSSYALSGSNVNDSALDSSMKMVAWGAGMLGGALVCFALPARGPNDVAGSVLALSGTFVGYIGGILALGEMAKLQ